MSIVYEYWKKYAQEKEYDYPVLDYMPANNEIFSRRLNELGLPTFETGFVDEKRLYDKLYNMPSSDIEEYYEYLKQNVNNINIDNALKIIYNTLQERKGYELSLLELEGGLPSLEEEEKIEEQDKIIEELINNIIELLSIKGLAMLTKIKPYLRKLAYSLDSAMTGKFENRTYLIETVIKNNTETLINLLQPVIEHYRNRFFYDVDPGSTYGIGIKRHRIIQKMEEIYEKILEARKTFSYPVFDF